MLPAGSYTGDSLMHLVTTTNGSRNKRPQGSTTGEGFPRPVTAKRQMVSRACDACKLRKVKCSGTLPCLNCTKRTERCRYETKYARGRPPTPSPPPPLAGNDNQASSSVQMSRGSLEARPLVCIYQPERSQDQLHTAVNELQTEPQSQPQTITPQRASPTVEGADIQGQYVEPTSGMAFLDRAWKRFSKQRPKCHEDMRLHTGQEWQQRQNCAGDKVFDGYLRNGTRFMQLPSLEVCKESVAYYHDVCVATYRFLHRPTVDIWLEKLHANVTDGMPAETDIGEMKAAVVLGVIAVAKFHQDRACGDNEPIPMGKSDVFFLAASELADAATGYPTLYSAQAKLVQVLYLLHTSRLNQAWYVFGHTLQILAALGLHRSTGRHGAPRGRAGNYIEAQCQRRCFWVAYILDTYLGILFGRPRHYHDENIDQVMPDTVNDEDMAPEGPRRKPVAQDCAITSLIFHVRIVRIVARITQTVYAIHQDSDARLADTIRQMRSDLDSWSRALPSILKSVNPSSLVFPFRRQAISMKMARAHAALHLNRPFLLSHVHGAISHGGPGESNTAASTSRAVLDCLDAAREVLHIVDTLAQDGTLFYAFWWTHYVAFCALTVVYVWEIQMSRTPLDTRRAQHDPSLFAIAESCAGHLAKATAANSPSRRYSIILEELRQEALSLSLSRPLQQDSHLLDVNHSIGGDKTTERVDTCTISELTFDGAMAPNDDIWGSLQTTDWLDIDSLALDPLAGLGTSPDSFMPDRLNLGL